MPPTHSRIDWLSFTAPITATWDSPEYRALAVAVMVRDLTGGVLAVNEDGLLPGRVPYHHSVGGRGVRVFFSDSGDVLCEISGEGCLALHNAGKLHEVVTLVQSRVSRIDHATDILTKVRPSEFVAACKRVHKSTSRVVSPTGETEYIGSMKNSRYARVYRYDGEHPRAEYLRCEHVFRKHDARNVAALWLEHGDDWLAGSCGKIFGWEHEVWTPNGGEKIKAWKPEKRNAKLHAWLAGQVVPAISNALTSGTLTTQEVARILRMKLTPSQLINLTSDLDHVTAPDADR